MIAKKCKRFGTENGFYGKHHSEETKRYLRRRNQIVDAFRTEEERKAISERFKRVQRELKEKDLNKYIQNKKRANKIGLISHKRYKTKSKPEILVENWLKDNNLDFQYSVILGFKQYDFGSKDLRILIEVQGDYWHGNPHFYNIDGSKGLKS